MKIKIALTDRITIVHEGEYNNLNGFIEQIESTSSKAGKFITLIGSKDKTEVAFNIDKVVAIELIK